MPKATDLGLTYKALDLHVHTPASQDDYKDKSITPSDIVEAAIAAGLQGICITDHNTADWCDAVRDAAKGKPLCVFPGVEISVTGGKEGPVHIVGIFDKDTTSEEINEMLVGLDLKKAERGKTTALAKGDSRTVIESIAKLGGIPVLAHADSSHGVLHDMKGLPRIAVVKNARLMAAEASNEKYRKALGGSDPEYGRFLPCYQSSDAHSLDEIGSKRTYFRASELSLDSLWLCLCDPDVRIRTEAEYEQCRGAAFPKILSVRIEQGFFDGETITFHPCQNVLIGGQGVGKSLLIEFIRFALTQQSSIPQIAADSLNKLQKQLRVGGRVVVEVQLSNEARYRITRIYDEVNNPTEVINLDTDGEYKGEIAQLFPVVAYSQTEAIHIATNPRAQLELIDRFVDAASFHKRREEIQKQLRSNDHSLVEASEALRALVKTQRELDTCSEAIANLELSLSNPALVDMKAADAQKAAFDREVDYHRKLDASVEEFVGSVVADYELCDLPEDLATNDRLRECRETSQSSLQAVRTALNTALAQIRANAQAVRGRFDQWLQEYTETEERYKELVEEAGGDQKALEAARQAQEEKRKGLETEVAKLQKASERLQPVLEARNGLLDQLDAVMSELHEARRKKYEALTEASAGKLLLTILQGADREAFSLALKEVSTGTRIRKNDLELVASRISPREFVDLVMREDVPGLADIGGLDQETAQKLVGWLSAMEAQEVFLALQHEYPVEDYPSIQYKIDNEGHKPISDVSMGQKCTALLIIALSAGDSPIIIDQPEEAIDIASVFGDIVSKLRSGKDRRQYILTTHNPNIAVTADSDLIQVLKSSATKGQIVERGAIDDPAVRVEVVQHVEGGEDAYLLRGKKYRLFGPGDVD